MATYTVSYRGKNGERIEEQFDAPDRNSLFKILADRKISAISVKDGAAPKRKKSSTPSKPLPPSVLRGAFAGVVLVALAVVVWLFVSSDTEESVAPSKKANGEINEYAPSKAGSGAVTNGIVGSSSELVAAGGNGSSEEDVAGTAKTNNVEDIGIEVCKKVKALQITAVDQLVNMVMTSPTDVPPPPLPLTAGMEDSLREMLKREITIKPDDEPDIVAMKKRMIENRGKVLALLDEGYTISDVLAKEHQMMTDAANLRRDAMKAMKEFEDEGDEESAKLYMEKANEKLQSLGVDPIYGSSVGKDRLNRIKAKRGE